LAEKGTIGLASHYPCIIKKEDAAVWGMVSFPFTSVHRSPVYQYCTTAYRI